MPTFSLVEFMCSNFHGYRPLDDVVEESRYTPKNIHVSRTRNTNLYLNKKDGLVVNFVIYYLSKLMDKLY